MLVPPEELERKAAELRAKLKEWELGYLVGLVEGEGGLCVHFKNRKGRYYPYLTIANINFEMLCYYRNKLNVGRIYHRSVKENGRKCYEWNIFSREALILLRAIFNYLFSCKKIKAALLLSLNKKNEGRYAELIYKQVKKLNNCEEDLNLQPKRINNFAFEGLTQFQLGLIAGLADSEGSIHIDKAGRPVFEITNTCPRLILKIFKILRGCGLRIRHPQRRRKIYIIYIKNRKVGPLLEDIKDFLIIKQKQAALMIEATRMLGQYGHRVSPAVRKRREELYWSIRALNVRGRVYSGGPTTLSSPHPRLGIEWNFPRTLVLIDV